MSSKRKMPPGRPFPKGGAEWARKIQRRGGLASTASRRKYSKPYAGTMLDMMDLVGMTDPSWAPWRTFWRAVFGLGLPRGGLGAMEHLERFQKHTGRTDAPTTPFAEAWAVCGRRGGKSRMAALLSLFLGIRFDCKTRLAPGEYGVVPVLAVDRKQARAVFKYLKAFCAIPAFKHFIHIVKGESVMLHTGVDIEVGTASYRSIRGYTLIGAVLDEVAFWMFEPDSLNADTEVVDALRPGLVDDGLLFAISSPYARKGELYEVHERYYGTEDKHILVWNADTLSMHPSYPQHRIDRAYEQDALAAASEYGSEGHVTFRRDVAGFLDAETIDAVVVRDRRELPPLQDVSYTAFVDPSGGSRDSFTLAIGHREGSDRAVLDCVRERKPPFSPDAVVQEFAELLQSYQVYEVTGDRYAGEWPVERFLTHGVRYVPSTRTKSDIYRELVAPINSQRIELLDLSALRSQLLSLERRVARGGRDSVDHPPHGHDDIANSVAGVLVLVLPSVGAPERRVQWA